MANNVGLLRAVSSEPALFAKLSALFCRDERVNTCIYVARTLLPQLFGPVRVSPLAGCLISFYYCPYTEIPVVDANRVDPDQMPHFVTSGSTLFPNVPFMGC